MDQTIHTIGEKTMKTLTKKKLIQKIQDSCIPVKKTGEDFETSDLRNIIIQRAGDVIDFPVEWYNKSEAINFVKKEQGKFFIRS